MYEIQRKASKSGAWARVGRFLQNCIDVLSLPMCVEIKKPALGGLLLLSKCTCTIRAFLCLTWVVVVSIQFA